MNKTKSVSITRVEAGKTAQVEDILVSEQDLTVRVNGHVFLRTTCSPGDTEALVYGHLLSEGIICSANGVASLEQPTPETPVQVTLSETSLTQKRNPNHVESGFTIPMARLLHAADEARDQGVIFHQTGGTHTAALFDAVKMINAYEDISRTCALEKALGDALLRGIDLAQTFCLLSSRLPKAFVRKLAHCGIPIVGAVSAPTCQAVKEAERLGICVCGFVRGERMNIYCNGWRVGRN